MKILIQKLKRFGLRRLIVRTLVLLVNKVRVQFYRIFLSDFFPNAVDTVILQPTQFLGRGKIALNSAQLGYWPSPGFLSGAAYIEARHPPATVRIGRGTFINNCFTIIADRSSIEIGDRCLIGPNFFACDSDFHGLELANRMNGNYETTPIFIGNDVFIGSDVKVLKGSRIGNGSVIGSGSVVVGDVEEHSIYAGVPAKKLRSLSA